MIKYVLLDTYNLVQSRNPYFIPCVINTLHSDTKLPWEECAYALAETTNHFRALDNNGAFLCHPDAFADELCSQLTCNRPGAKIDPFQIHRVLYAISIMALPHGNSECLRTIEYLTQSDIAIGMISNTNMFSTIEIATQIELEYYSGIYTSLTACNSMHYQMPNDRVWADITDLSGLKANEILFVTTNSRYATNASASNIETAVVSGYDDLFKSIQKRTNLN